MRVIPAVRRLPRFMNSPSYVFLLHHYSSSRIISTSRWSMAHSIAGSKSFHWVDFNKSKLSEARAKDESIRRTNAPYSAAAKFLKRNAISKYRPHHFGVCLRWACTIRSTSLSNKALAAVSTRNKKCALGIDFAWPSKSWRGGAVTEAKLLDTIRKEVFLLLVL